MVIVVLPLLKRSDMAGASIQVSAQPQQLCSKTPRKPVAKLISRGKCGHGLLASRLLSNLRMVVLMLRQRVLIIFIVSLSCVVDLLRCLECQPFIAHPLMSVTNAISGIIVVGALLQISSGGWWLFIYRYIFNCQY